MNKRLKKSILWGFGLTAALFLFDIAAAYLFPSFFFPYRDKPTMPRLALVLPLLPGFLITELVSENVWFGAASALVLNSALYSFCAYWIAPFLRSDPIAPNSPANNTASVV